MRYGVARADRIETSPDHDFVAYHKIQYAIGVKLSGLPQDYGNVDGLVATRTSTIRFDDLNTAAWFCDWCNSTYMPNRSFIRYKVVERND